MTSRRKRRAITAACVMALAALALMGWSLVDPRPLPVVVAMSVGQALGTFSFLLYIAVVISELWKKPDASVSRRTSGS